MDEDIEELMTELSSAIDFLDVYTTSITECQNIEDHVIDIISEIVSQTTKLRECR